MRIAILSDSHDDVQRLACAIALMDALKPDAIIHCGDLCAPQMLQPLAGRRVYFVFGNNDFEQKALRDAAARLDMICLGHCGQVTLDGKSIAILHGHDPRAREGMLAAGVDYLFSGHTHEPHDLRQGATRLINPGALYRTSRKTFAVVDLATDALTTHAIA